MFCCILSITIIYCTQHKQNTNAVKKPPSKEIPDSVFWASIYLLDEWKEIVSLDNGIKWFISKKSISRNDEVVKIPVMVYLPRYKSSQGEAYKDVIMNEIVDFNCNNNEYRINSIIYKSEFANVFNSIENDNSSFKKVQNNTIWEPLLNFSCGLKK